MFVKIKFLYRNRTKIFIWMNYLTDSITGIKKDLQQKEKEGTFFLQYEKGEASWKIMSCENDLFSLLCRALHSNRKLSIRFDFPV